MGVMKDGMFLEYILNKKEMLHSKRDIDVARRSSLVIEDIEQTYI